MLRKRNVTTRFLQKWVSENFDFHMSLRRHHVIRVK